MTLTRALAGIAALNSGRGMRLLHRDDEVERTTYQELYEQAGHIACALLERGVRPGQRVALALPASSIAFARAFFGVLAAGGVAVPVPPPVRFGSLEVHLRRITLALRQSEVRVIVSDDTLSGLLEPLFGGPRGEFRILDLSQVPAGTPEYAEAEADAPALVQYTSGTSERPRGVVLSHANLLANVGAITRSLDLTSADVGCSWLPMFHDMGLIGTLLCAVLNDTEACVLPPEDFLRDPGSWLRMISRYRGTIGTAPNSGYLHALRKVSAEEVRGLDLSSWRVALNGAEPVDAETMRLFAARFAPAGFRAEAFLPVYGLAEASLAVTFPPTGRGVRSVWVDRDALGEGMAVAVPGTERTAREVVSVGTPVDGTEVGLVTPDGSVADEEGRVGEIRVRGASVMAGYEADEEATGAVVHPGGWVSTGDLGFRQDGELYVAGRVKEMIILLGRNYYASDIEAIVGRVPGVAHKGVHAAGLALPEGEALVIVAETRTTDPVEREELASAIRGAVSESLGISPRHVLLVKRGRLARTSSGKIQRYGIESVYRDHGLLPSDDAPDVRTPRVLAGEGTGV